MKKLYRRQYVWIAVLLMIAAGCGTGSESADPSPPDAGGGPTDSQETDAGVQDGGGETVSLRYASPAATGSALWEQAEWYVNEVEARSEGKIEFETFYDGSLIGAAEGMDAVSEGRVDGAFLSHAYNPGRIPLWEVGGLPFITDNALAVMHSMNGLYEDNELFREAFQQEGLRPLFFHTIGEGLSYLSSPVDGLDGLNGLRLRVLGGGTDAFEEIGVEPVAVDPGEMYEAIQRGVLDGAGSWALESAASFGMAEVAPHIVDIGIGSYASSAFVISEDSWSQLSEDLQAVMQEVATELMETEAVQIFERVNDEACTTFLDAGGSVTLIDEADYAAVRDKVMESAVETWANESTEATGASRERVDAFFEDYRDRIESNSAQTDYVPEGTACGNRQ